MRRRIINRLSDEICVDYGEIWMVDIIRLGICGGFTEAYGLGYRQLGMDVVVESGVGAWISDSMVFER